jgi:hypothetical protein
MTFSNALKNPFSQALSFQTLWQISVLTLILSACAPMAPQSPGLSTIDPQRLQLPKGEHSTVKSNWWEDFHNKELSVLIQSALENNPGIALVNTRIEKAQSMAGLTRSASSVQANLGLDVDRQRFSQTGIYPPPLGGSVQTLTTLQLSGAWIPDVFGKYKRAYESALGQVQASALEALHAKSQLSAQIAIQFIALALSVDERDLLDQRSQQITALRQLVSERIKAGLDSSLELKSLEIESNEILFQRSQVDNQIEMYRHALATLSAREPQALSGLSPHLQELQPINVQTDWGIDILGNRADVVAAKTRVLAAIKGVEVSQLDFYPNIGLGFFSGFNSLKISQLTQNPSAQYGFVPSLSLPIFDGGRLNAQLGSKTAERDQAIALYNSTLLEALKEASDAVGTLKSSQKEGVLAQASLKISNDRLNLQTQNAKAGLNSQVSVLRETLSQLQMQRLSAQSLAKTLNSEVVLLKALGAGGTDSNGQKHALTALP